MAHKYSASKTPQKTVSVVGARGYSGLELSKLLLNHPAVQLTNAYATQAFSLSDDLVNPAALSVKCSTQDSLMENLTDIVFLATPAEVSRDLAPKILKAGKKVIDLSGAFRLKKNDISKWYGFTPETKLVAESDYGLVPYCGALKPSVNLIANPGCYATAISLALIPLLKHNLIEADGLVIDAKSGTTGAGRKPAENLLFSEVTGECLPYRVGKHQHTPEIQESVEKFSGTAIDPHFATHLLPTKRGILASIYARSKTQNLGDIENAFTSEYAGYALAHHGSTYSKWAKLDKVVNTPYVHFSYELTGNKLYIFSALDNLMKGAASQAVENLNRMLDLPVGFALDAKEGWGT